MKPSTQTAAAVAIGGALGSLCRLALVSIAAPGLAVGAANLFGSIIIGYFARRPRSTATAGVTVGFCGGLTTLSTWAVLTTEQWRAGQPASAMATVALTVFTVLGGVTLGARLALWRR